MANEKVLIIVVEVHAVALAVLPHLAVGTLALLRPCAVTELLEAVLSHVPEAILIYITLREVGTYRRTARDVAIHAYRRYADTCMTLERVGAGT